MWIDPPCVQPVAPFWIGVLCFAVGLLAVSGLVAAGAFSSIIDALMGAVRRIKVRHAVFLPAVASLLVFGSTKPEPPPVVVEKGIRLSKCVQTSRRIEFEWIAEDSRIPSGATYYVQEWLGGKWVTVAETMDSRYVLVGFTIDATRRYRIVTDVTEAADE